MRYGFIQAHRSAYPIRVLCRVMQVSHSAYYSWCHRSGEVIDSWNLAAVSPDEGAVQGLSAESLEILADKSARSAKGFLQPLTAMESEAKAVSPR